ncbi:MAG: N(5)-(carboxyethyl)ornithine synthase [Peptococcaceae bacterium BICA1-8]|nr:MAG: N(5)-(carboxyethyl)ornithine synthase [Peptococcaceae bacterium BICA1-8]
MKSVGFIISTKENERRRALLPEQISKIKNKDYLYFERGYGEVLGYTDDDYIKQGVNILSKEEILTKDVICDPKIGDADYLLELKENQTIFGYVHAVKNRDITEKIIEKSLTAIAWEEMHENGRHVFWRNNELAGEAAIMHAFTIYGRMPYDCKVAIMGRGNIARGAYRILSSLGAEIVVYDRKMESLLRKKIAEYDVIVNGVLWDNSREDFVIYREDIMRMKKSSIIIDISCDTAGCIETSVPTTLEDPVYFSEGILHYVADHTPSIVFYTASKSFGKELIRYIDVIIKDKIESNITIKNAIIIKNGVILDEKINEYQNR